MPSRPIERGLAGPGVLTHVLVAKFADHLPLYRQAFIYARNGVDLDSALLRPFADAIWRPVLTDAKLHEDDTSIPVLAPGNWKTTTARLWIYVHDDRSSGNTTPPAVWLAYTPDRKGIHSQTLPANYKGVLQAHAYAGFNAAERALRGLPGPRNYLFAGADTSGERAAAIHSLIGSAELNGVDPEA